MNFFCLKETNWIWRNLLITWKLSLCIFQFFLSFLSSWILSKVLMCHIFVSSLTHMLKYKVLYMCTNIVQNTLKFCYQFNCFWLMLLVIHDGCIFEIIFTSLFFFPVVFKISHFPAKYGVFCYFVFNLEVIHNFLLFHSFPSFPKDKPTVLCELYILMWCRIFLNSFKRFTIGLCKFSPLPLYNLNLDIYPISDSNNIFTKPYCAILPVCRHGNSLSPISSKGWFYFGLNISLNLFITYFIIDTPLTRRLTTWCIESLSQTYCDCSIPLDLFLVRIYWTLLNFCNM